MNSTYDSYKRYQQYVNAKCVIKFMFHPHESRELINQARKKEKTNNYRKRTFVWKVSYIKI